jgi:c-di-AMP phosphodiesterase-like protein
MPEWISGRWVSFHSLILFLALFCMSFVLFFISWIVGAIVVVILIGLGGYVVRAERKHRKQLIQYIATVSHRVKRAAHEVISELPIGIVLFDEEKKVEWCNPFINTMMNREILIGESLQTLWPAIKPFKDKELAIDLAIGKRSYRVIVKSEERLLYFTDYTEITTLSKKYDEDKIVLGLIVLDNVDEVTQGMDDHSRGIMMASVVNVINEWALRHHSYLRRTSSDRFLLLFSNKQLGALEQSRFDLLDEVKEATHHLKLPVTLSIGIAGGLNDYIKLGQAAQMSLDIALGRGGDQVAVKMGDRVSFYGGRSNAVEKRTRVRARVISHALRDLIKESQNVMIMGHKAPDMDSIGAALGMMKAADVFGIPSYIVLEDVNPSIERLIEWVSEDDETISRFISPNQALELMTNRSLAVVVDTHKLSLLAEPKLISQTKRIVVIDHHRRGEEFISEATLIYMEPYASSTCELVTELLQYIQDGLHVGVLESTALLAGIVTDTRSFSVRTGSRTFEAASFLRRNGADSNVIQRLLKDDLSDYLKKADIMRNAQIVRKHYVVATTAPGQRYAQLLIAQVADTLLNMHGIVASFVVSERSDGWIGISARSLGQVNVQVLMEQLGGGGHLTNAATQIDGTVKQATDRLISILDEYEEREGLSS